MTTLRSDTGDSGRGSGSWRSTEIALGIQWWPAYLVSRRYAALIGSRLPVLHLTA